MTQDDVERIVANFDRRMDPGRPLVACASCGVRALDEPCALILQRRDLPTDHWLRFTSEQRQELQGLPDVTLLSSAGDTRSVNLSILYSYYRDCDDAFYHVHPELLEFDRASGAASIRRSKLTTMRSTSSGVTTQCFWMSASTAVTSPSQRGDASGEPCAIRRRNCSEFP